MKTVKFLLFVVLSMSLSLAVQAQSQPDSKSNNREIGFGTNVILSEIFRTDGSPFDFIYRWRSGSGYKRIGGSVGLNGNIEKVQGYGNGGTSFSSKIFLGKEWRADLATRWILNYGGDLTAGYLYSQTKHVSFSDNVLSRAFENSNRIFSLGFRPFVGLIFKVNDQFYLGTEASVGAELGRGISNKESYEITDGRRGSNLDVGRTYRWIYNLHSVAAGNIFVYYRF